MKVWGSLETPNKIEFISYSPEYHDQVFDVLRKSFFVNENVAVACGIDKNLEAQKELELLCEDALKRSGVSMLARDVEKNLIVGIALNVIQVIKCNLHKVFIKICSRCRRSGNRQVTLRLISNTSAISTAKPKTRNRQ